MVSHWLYHTIRVPFKSFQALLNASEWGPMVSFTKGCMHACRCLSMYLPTYLHHKYDLVMMSIVSVYLSNTIKGLRQVLSRPSLWRQIKRHISSRSGAPCNSFYNILTVILHGIHKSQNKDQHFERILLFTWYVRQKRWNESFECKRKAYIFLGDDVKVWYLSYVVSLLHTLFIFRETAALQKILLTLFSDM